MRILRAQPRGFCAGVAMAVDALNRALDVFGDPLYAFHQIVHNREVVADFAERGVRFVDRLEEVPRAATNVFSAHGVSPCVRAQAMVNAEAGRASDACTNSGLPRKP